MYLSAVPGLHAAAFDSAGLYGPAPAQRIPRVYLTDMMDAIAHGGCPVFYVSFEAY